MTNDGAISLTGDFSNPFGQIFNVNDGGTLSIAGDMTVDVNDSISMRHQRSRDRAHLRGVQFPGRQLHVETFDGNLKNQGGPFAPGNSTGSTLALGDYAQVNGALEIEIGGPSPGSQHDHLSVTGNVVLQGGDLELRLLNGFTPGPADEFAVLNSNNLLGFFNNVDTADRLETLDGRGSFLVHYGPTSEFDPDQIWLTEFQLARVPGDYNEDGVVNAADYVVWRNHEGTDFDLPNRDPSLMGNIGQTDYNFFWVDNFGATGGSGSSSNGIPEPASLLLWGLTAASKLHRPGRNH